MEVQRFTHLVFYHNKMVTGIYICMFIIFALAFYLVAIIVKTSHEKHREGGSDITLVEVV